MTASPWFDPLTDELAVAAACGDGTAASVLHDVLAERGAPEAIAAESWPVQVLRLFDAGSFLAGGGIGRGSGIGSAIGRGGGGGGIGSGSGIGIGSGWGCGRGIGSSSGIGGGIGIDSGARPGSVRVYEIKPMEIGKAYLVHLGDWHTVCGRVVAQAGPLTYRMDRVSKIADTRAGDCWERLAAGDEALRAGCDYRHYTTPVVIPLTIMAVEWVGKLPQEATP